VFGSIDGDALSVACVAGRGALRAGGEQNQSILRSMNPSPEVISGVISATRIPKVASQLAHEFVTALLFAVRLLRVTKSGQVGALSLVPLLPVVFLSMTWCLISSLLSFWCRFASVLGLYSRSTKTLALCRDQQSRPPAPTRHARQVWIHVFRNFDTASKVARPNPHLIGHSGPCNAITEALRESNPLSNNVPRLAILSST